MPPGPPSGAHHGARQGKIAHMSAQRRIHAGTVLRAGASVRLGGEAANHVLRVLRLQKGDSLTLFDGSGRDFPGSIVALDHHALTVALGSAVAVARESPLAITLLQGICRSARMDTVIQKSTELGVARIVPVATERSVVRLDEDQAARRLGHWQRIAISACEQSGRSRIPEIRAVGSLRAGLEIAGDQAVRVFLNPQAAQSLSDLPATAGTVAVLIGPEGGLTEAEAALASAAGFTPLRVGPRILRAETAPLAALTLLQYRYGDLAR